MYVNLFILSIFFLLFDKHIYRVVPRLLVFSAKLVTWTWLSVWLVMPWRMISVCSRMQVPMLWLANRWSRLLLISFSSILTHSVSLLPSILMMDQDDSISRLSSKDNNLVAAAFVIVVLNCLVLCLIICVRLNSYSCHCSIILNELCCSVPCELSIWKSSLVE